MRDRERESERMSKRDNDDNEPNDSEELKTFNILKQIHLEVKQNWNDDNYNKNRCERRHLRIY